MSGKNYSRNRPREERNEADFYQTPYCLTDEFMKTHVLRHWPENSQIFDFCSGEGAIPKVIEKYPYGVHARDIREGFDFFDTPSIPAFEYGLMNPPFRFFNKWVKHCFNIFTESFALLAPTTYLQGISRFNIDGTGIFQNRLWPLSHIYTFNRYPMLEKELRPDGLIKTGMQALSWFVWTKSHDLRNVEDTRCRWLDINQYVLRKA